MAAASDHTLCSFALLTRFDKVKCSFDYSKSFDFGFRPGSFDKKPKIKSETKKITTV